MAHRSIHKLMHFPGIVKRIEMYVADQERGERRIPRIQSVCRALPLSVLGGNRLRLATAGQWEGNENQGPNPKSNLQPKVLPI